MAGLKELRLRDFSGGLNLRDAQSELAPNESPDLWNVTLDERGGVDKRLGYTKYNTEAYASAKVTNLFQWTQPSIGTAVLIVQCGTGLFRDVETTPFKTFTTPDRCGLADFAGKLCIVHPVDGFWTWDGTTLTPIATGPWGDSLAVWQNKLWANTRLGVGNPSRVRFSAAGDPTTWNSADF